VKGSNGILRQAQQIYRVQQFPGASSAEQQQAGAYYKFEEKKFKN